MGFRFQVFKSIGEGFKRGSAPQVPALVGALLVVEGQVSVQVFLHFLQSLIPFLAALEAEMLVEQGSMEAFDEAV